MLATKGRWKSCRQISRQASATSEKSPISSHSVLAQAGYITGTVVTIDGASPPAAP